MSGAIADDADFENEYRNTKRFTEQIRGINERTPFSIEGDEEDELIIPRETLGTGTSQTETDHRKNLHFAFAA